jgi:hypothetical protein
MKGQSKQNQGLAVELECLCDSAGVVGSVGLFWL